MIDDIKAEYNLARMREEDEENTKRKAMTDDIEVTPEMLAAAVTFINENHDGDSIPMAQLLHEGYVVMETIRRKRAVIDREMAIAKAVSGAIGHA